MAEKKRETDGAEAGSDCVLRAERARDCQQYTVYHGRLPDALVKFFGKSTRRRSACACR